MDLTGLPLFENQKTPAPKTRDLGRKAFSVSQLTAKIRGLLEPSLSNVWVQGEISNFRPAASGHVYFSLKDQQASLSAAVFGWNKKNRMGFQLRDGLQVLCRGRVTVYPPRGSYQLVIEQIEPLGAGALQAAFEDLKKKLRTEGLFEASRKKSIPKFPNTLAVVTSPTGAAVRDVIQVVSRRAKNMRVIVVPALVQGDAAPRDLIRALEIIERDLRPDAILLARGGGSLEDLWAFNNEELARRIAASEIPIVSAIGHETDFTIADFVADLRAPTPSAGAEIITAGWVEVRSRVSECGHRLLAAFQRGLDEKSGMLHSVIGRRLFVAMRRQVTEKRRWIQLVSQRLISPRDRLKEQHQRVDEVRFRLDSAIERFMDRFKGKFEQAVAQLSALSPLRVLERGYSILRDPEKNDKLIKSVDEVKLSKRLRITFHDGDATIQIRNP